MGTGDNHSQVICAMMRPEQGRAHCPRKVGAGLGLEGCVTLTGRRWWVGYSSRGRSPSKGWESGNHSVTVYHQARKGVWVMEGTGGDAEEGGRTQVVQDWAGKPGFDLLSRKDAWKGAEQESDSVTR